MNLNEYQELASRTANTTLNESEQLCNWAMGLCGEAGEYSELIKKKIFHNKEITQEQILSELGDCLWYLAQAARSNGLDLEEIAQFNISKLRKRYPEGFVEKGGIR